MRTTRRRKPLAWRNAWDIPELTKMTDAAVLERDGAKRAKMYQDIQADFRKTSPFVMLYQQTEVAAFRANVDGLKLGPTSDIDLHVRGRSKRRRRDNRAEAPLGVARRRALPRRSSLLTYLGLLAVTFFIGRVIPIDPVLAIVGDRAPEHVDRAGARRARPQQAAAGSSSPST